MKFLTLLPRGIEGCGVTKNSIDFTKFINENTEHQAKCIANLDIKWGSRSESHEDYIQKIKFIKNIDLVKQYIDQYDILIFMCTPLKKSSDKIKQNFIEILKYAKQKNKFLIYFQFDHTKRSLQTNMYSDKNYMNIFEYFNIIFNHSYENDFIKKIIQPNNIKIKKLICRGDYNIENIFGINFELLKNKYWKTFDEKQYKTIKFIGRSTVWKGPWLFRDLHYNYFMKDGWISSIEGLELSMGMLAEIYEKYRTEKIQRKDVDLTYLREKQEQINNEKYKLNYNNPIYLFPIYINDYAMNRLSKCQFGIELLKLKDYFSYDTIENAMFEIIATGCIPIFRKGWAQKFKVKGKPLISYGEQTGTVFIDENNPQETIPLLNNLANNKELYDKWRNNAYNFYKELYDVNNVYSKLVQVILKQIKSLIKNN